MKTTLFCTCATLFSFFLTTPTSYCQQLYTMTGLGGANEGGAILSMSTNGTFQVEFAFLPPNGFHPMGNMVQANNGKCYGVCLEGGIYGSCTIFCWDPVVKTYNDVYDFDITNGDFPTSTPVEVTNGILYGTGLGGGINGIGVIYSYDYVNDVYIPVHSFDNIDSLSGYHAAPYGDLILHSNGKLYGMTTHVGVTNHAGEMLYSFDPATNGYSELYHFDSISGKHPFGGLVEHNGILYGLTTEGGLYNGGVLFSFNPANNGFSVLHEFNEPDGSAPAGTLLATSTGLLYGLTSAGGTGGNGVLFRFNPSTQDYAALHHFDGADGSMLQFVDSTLGYFWVPQRNSLNELNGILYGATSSGGEYNKGTLFSFDAATLAYTVLLHLDASHGVCIDGGFAPVQEPNGSLTGFISASDQYCGEFESDLQLTAHIRNGIGPYSFIWNTGATTQSIEALSLSGVEDYSVTITDIGKSETVTSAIQVSGKPSKNMALAVSEYTVTIDYDTAGVSYQINFGDGSGWGTSLVHTYASIGTYPVTLTVNNTCGSETINKTATIVDVSIRSVSANLSFNIFPNPGNGSFILSGKAVERSTDLEIFDLSGKLLLRQQLDAAPAMNEKHLDLSQLSQGVYLLRLNSGGNTGMRKLVIN